MTRLRRRFPTGSYYWLMTCSKSYRMHSNRSHPNAPSGLRFPFRTNSRFGDSFGMTEFQVLQVVAEFVNIVSELLGQVTPDRSYFFDQRVGGLLACLIRAHSS